MPQSTQQELLRMLVIDESGKAVVTLEKLFQDSFVVSTLDCDRLVESINDGVCAPHIIIYVSLQVGTEVVPAIRHIRSKWPKTIVLLLLPSARDEKQVREASDIPAHKIIFRPCSKQKIVDSVENYLSLIEGEGCTAQENALLSCLMEFTGGKRPELYVAYNRVMPLIMTLCQSLGFDWRHAQKVFILYMVLLSNVDEGLVFALMDGGGRKQNAIKRLYEEVLKMVDLLSMSPATEELSKDLKYVLKRYDGDGFPEDDVKEFNIPAPARVIRLLLDYHYLLQAGKSTGQALYIISHRKGWYDDVLVQSLIEMLGDEAKSYTREVYPLGLVTGMVVAEDVYGYIDGKRRKILSENEILTDNAVDYLQRHSEDILDITEPVKIVEELFSEEGVNHA